MLFLSKHYVLLTCVTKIILEISQKTNVTSQTVQKLFYEEQGKKVIKKVIGISSSLIEGQTVKEVAEPLLWAQKVMTVICRGS